MLSFFFHSCITFVLVWQHFLSVSEKLSFLRLLKSIKVFLSLKASTSTNGTKLVCRAVVWIDIQHERCIIHSTHWILSQRYSPNIQYRSDQFNLIIRTKTPIEYHMEIDSINIHAVGCFVPLNCYECIRIR